MNNRQLTLFSLAVVLVCGITSIGHSSAATRTKRLCSRVTAGNARCFVNVLTDEGGIQALTVRSPRGYGPTDFRAAYGSTTNRSAHVAIVSAYDAPTIADDLAAYSRAYGLPVPTTCGLRVTAGCFEKLNQHGSSINLPHPNSSWSVESSLDVETVHGICQSCSISLVEASSSSITDLSAAVDAAVAQGATIVSNSYGGPEFAAETTFDEHYHHPGVTMVVSSGDSGYGTSYPAASTSVIAVGGTTMQLNHGLVTNETAWQGAGSGCSKYEPKPAWQTDSRCHHRSIADISADADPRTGAAIYASYGQNGKGWMTLGGTSLAAPLVAALIATSQNPDTLPAQLYSSAKASNLRDIQSGANGSCRTYLCRSINGYDGPTGLGVLYHW